MSASKKVQQAQALADFILAQEELLADAPARFAALAGAAVLLAVPNLGAAYQPVAVYAWFHGTNCAAIIQDDPAAYFACFNRLAWHPTVGLVSSVARAAVVNHPVLTFGLTAGHLGLWRWLWTTPRKLEGVRKLLASIEGERP